METQKIVNILNKFDYESSNFVIYGIYDENGTGYGAWKWK